MKMITYAEKKGIIVDSAQLAVSFCMYSDELATCQTSAQGGVFKEPVDMSLWNADDYVVEEDEERFDTEEGRGFQDMSDKVSGHQPPSPRCDWCEETDDEEAGTEVR